MPPAVRPVNRLAVRVGLVAAVLAVFIACDESNPAAPTPVPCASTLSSQSQSFTAEGGPGAVSISTDSACSWSVAGATGWVTLLSPTSAVGTGSVNFTVLPNAEQAAREKILTVASLPFTIRQDGRMPCSFSISPEQKNFDDDGGTAQVTVTAAAGCGWTARTNVAWITVTAGAEGQGSGSVTYAVTPNNATTARTGTLTIAGRTFTVDQTGENITQPADCLYSVAPVDFTPCMAGGRLTATVTTQPNCTWTAAPGASWLQIPSGRSGTGSGVVTIAFSDNYGAPRDGTVMVRWPTPTAGQNIQVAQAGCTYAVSKNAVSFAAAGGPGTFDVIQQSLPNSCGGPLQDQCVWTARSDAPWITVTSSMPRSGDDPVSSPSPPTPAQPRGLARSPSVTRS
jgi:Viral BACON domain/Putative binding domain, N-terminal